MLRLKKKKNKIETKYHVSSDLVAQDPNTNITVVRTEYRQFYDGKWVVITPHFSATITRSDGETAEELMEEILKLPAITKEAIESLDEKAKIWYD